MSVDDEMHCLFACPHRDLRQARARLCAIVFGGSGHVPASLSHMFKSQEGHPANLARVARFVAHCLLLFRVMRPGALMIVTRALWR